jgi:cholesterol oxidase
MACSLRGLRAEHGVLALVNARSDVRFAATPLPGAGRGVFATLRRWADREWWRRVTVLTAMQAWSGGSGELRLGLARRWWWPWRTALASHCDGARPPARLPIAEDVARAVATAAGGGTPFVLGFASVTGRAVTAHILGGCAIGASPADGVVDAGHEAFGHPGLFVVDGSAAPADIGVNPSLTITALAERCLARWAPRSAS